MQIFARQFLPAVQAGLVDLACCNRRLNGTARFGLMGAVAEFTGMGEVFEIGEKLSHTRGNVGEL